MLALTLMLVNFEAHPSLSSDHFFFFTVSNRDYHTRFQEKQPPQFSQFTPHGGCGHPGGGVYDHCFTSYQ